MLSDRVGLELKFIGKEVRAGKYRTDILAMDDISGNNVIIENQLEGSNHDHLGKCLTYMAQHQAKYCIWICKELQPEHRKAINLLNETTESDYRFYGIELKTFQLGEEKVYTFHLAAEPNFDEKYLQNLKDMKNPKVVYLNQFWEKVRAKLPLDLQKHFRIQYSGKSYANLAFDNFSFWISTNFSSTKKKAKVSIITNEDDTFRQLTQIVEGVNFKKFYTRELRKEDGKRNPNWHFYIDEIDYKERPEEVIDWLAKSASQMYQVLMNSSTFSSCSKKA